MAGRKERITMVSEAELLRRAREVSASLDLGYMSASGEYDRGRPEGQNPFPEDVARFMVYATTDGGDDGWLHFYATPEQLAAAIAGLISDEWGLNAAFDLEAAEYARPIAVSAVIRVAGATVEAAV